MRKSLIIAALLLANTATAGEHTYNLHGMQIMLNQCGHAKDLLKDSYKIHFIPQGVIVNYTEWRLDYQSSDSFLIEYKAEPDAFTQLDLVYFKDIKTGYLTLSGTTENRDVCFDRISLTE